MPQIVEEYRRDRGALLAPRWENDTLFVEGYICRPGVYEYKNADGTITRELIRDEMLKDCAVQLARLPCTLEHPEKDVDARNWQEIAVGDAADEVIIEDNGYQRVKMAVRRKDAQQDVLNKKRKECSPGYLAKIDKTPGEHPEYGRYDAEQVGRTYNHIAFVTDARGGPRIAVRLDDGAELVTTIRGDQAVEQPTRGDPMAREDIDPRVWRYLALRGVNVARVDSAEQALRFVMDSAGVAPQNNLPPGSQPMTGDMGGPSYMGGDMGGPPQMPTPDAGGGQFPMTPDGQPMYQDAEGNPLTQDQYMDMLEQENDEYRKQLEGDAEESAMQDLTPMAEDMDVPVEKKDSAYDVALKLAGKRLGMELHPQTSPDFVWGVIQTIRKDSGLEQPGQGRAAGQEAWNQARRDSRDPDNVRRRVDAARSGGVHPSSRQDGDDGQVISLEDVWEARQRANFQARRDAARGVR